MFRRKFFLAGNQADKFSYCVCRAWGPKAVRIILDCRKKGRVNRLEDVMRRGKLLDKALDYVNF